MEEFYSKVIDRNTLQDGSLADPGLLNRMQHPYCVECTDEYKTKFPGKAFQIVCSGIYGDEELEEIAQLSDVPVEEVKDIYNLSYWATRHIRLANDEGTLQAYEARWYQDRILRCTAKRKVDRLARGLGKTVLGEIEELQICTTRPNYKILIACPAKAQAEKWYNDIKDHIDNNPDLSSSLKRHQQAPYYQLEFHNKSKISIFTTGSDSGKGAATIRGQSPRRVRADEQDLFVQADYKAIKPLLRRFKDSEFHGSSTPTGKREDYWEMCTQLPDYKEFYYPISVHPYWNTETINEEICRREARTDTMYDHEFLAIFGDLEQGVFKQCYVDLARKDYKYSDIRYNSSLYYFMGVDWNGMGTGTRIRVVEYSLNTRMIRVVDHDMVYESNQESLNRIRLMNRKWHCASIFVDAGNGQMQDEVLKKMGVDSTDPDDKRLKDVRSIDSGANLTFNRLVPRITNSKYINIDENEIDRRTKPFMVEGAVMIFEQERFSFSEYDKILEEQIRAYRVKSWSAHGYANVYESAKGDHDLDALILALLAVEYKFGLLADKPKPIRGTGASMLPAIGAGQVEKRDQVTSVRETQQKLSGIPSRTRSDNPSLDLRIAYMRGNSAIVSRGDITSNRTGRIPQSTSIGRNRPGPGNRTAMFRKNK